MILLGIEWRGLNIDVENHINDIILKIDDPKKFMRAMLDNYEKNLIARSGVEKDCEKNVFFGVHVLP